jgi:hypothetical protein
MPAKAGIQSSVEKRLNRGRAIIKRLGFLDRRLSRTMTTERISSHIQSTLTMFAHKPAA